MPYKRILFTICVLLLLLFAWYAIDVLLLGFAGILVAVFLRGTANFISRYTNLSVGWSLAITILSLLIIIGLAIWYFTPQVARQVDALTERLPQAVNALEANIKDYRWGQRVLEQLPPPDQLMPKRENTLSRMTGIVSTTFGYLVEVVIVLFVGLYLAINPKTYLSGIKYLVPPDKRERAAEVFAEIGHALRWWLVGQFASMLIIGVLTWLGLWLLGVPLSLTFGILAGLLEFIPRIGPLLSFVPAALLALIDNPTTALYVAGLYLGIQIMESYLIIPLVQKKAVELPPALTLLAVVLMGILVGGIGIMLATPLTVVVIVLVKMLYVRDTLDDKTVADGID